MKNKKLSHNGLQGSVTSVMAALLCILIGLFVGFLVLLAINPAHAWADGFVRILKGGFHDAPYGVGKELANAAPLIMTGLSVGFAFKTGLFNIGGNGQIIVGALAAVWVGFSMDLPPVVHTFVAVAAAIIAGAAYAGIAGVLKAKTGANEVIVTIMLNSIAVLGLGYVLSQPSWQRPGSNQPVTPNVADTAAFAKFFDGPIKLHSGIIVALIALVIFWWLMERSTLGFQIRVVGANPAAARTAGISVERITAVTMLFSGAFLGLAGANEALGTLGYASRDVAGSIGFDAITVALLGRNKAWGTFGAGLLFGAFKAGGYAMQAKNVPIDMILILQSVIVLLIAAPALVRWLFRLPDAKRLAAAGKGNDE